MCEFLIMNRDRWSGDELKHLSDYKKDDPVTVKPDGFQWEGETLNRKKFWILKMPGISVKKGQTLLEPEYDSLNRRILVRKRKYSFDRERLSEAAKTHIEENADFTVSNLKTITDVRNYIRPK